MGFEYIPWISDMLDLSGGFGSRQLSMNQGLAHLQASAYMNSCWNVGGGFMPYNSFGNGMEFLLDPSFAMWQTSNGISSSANMYGNLNLGNYSNFGNFGNFRLPWQQTPPSNNGGGNSDLSPAEQTDKDKFTDLKTTIDNFANSIINNKDNEPAANVTKANRLKNRAKEIMDNKDKNWEEKLTELRSLYNTEIMGDSATKNKYKDFIKNNMTVKFEVNSKIKDTNGSNLALRALIQKTGYGNDVSGVNIDDIKKCLDALKKGENANASALESINENNILEFLSAYNSKYNTGSGNNDFICYFVSKYTALSPDKANDAESEQERALTSFNKVRNALIDRARGIADQLLEDASNNDKKYKSALEKAITELADAEVNNDIKGKFNNLYAMVRMAEIKVIEREIDSRFCGDPSDGNNLPSALLNLSGETEADLEKEGITTVPKVECKPVETMQIVEAPEGSSGSEGSGSASSTVTKTQSDMEKDFCDNEDYKDCFEKTGKVVDGKTVYKWTDGPMAGNSEITAGTLFVIDDGKARKLTKPENRLYGVQISEYTDNDLSNGTKIYIWKGENCTKDGVTVKSGDLCVIIDNVPRPLTKDENTEYGLMTKQETDGNVDNNAVYKWTHTKECNGVKKGDLFVIKNNKPEKLTNNDLNKFIISVSEKKGEFDYTDADSQTKKIPVYKNTGEACTVNGETIGTGEFFTVENGKVRTFTSDEAARIPDDMLV